MYVGLIIAHLKIPNQKLEKEGGTKRIMGNSEYNPSVSIQSTDLVETSINDIKDKTQRKTRGTGAFILRQAFQGENIS